ncbi:PEP-CTERM sorting domain-containing protein [Thalassoglobus polymorphus]|uniref:PEP-CTERM motif protein n=1 Tax=Thalassoglobus polymorphus TaxID=2527994 RepID=A0A517QHF1_9PLAN|nr:PEP-CTERM sorting domain-containing protein [Thalassoglobus polymorphus]QDT31066.1 PEP-CTERM motif protein [Thalassoglobus polymorphus]
MIRAIQRAAACVAVLIATAGQVQAGIINSADVIIGGNSFSTFTDDSTSLVWLDLDNFWDVTSTYNSIDSLLAGSGFHLATLPELNILQASIPAVPANFSSEVVILGGNYVGNPHPGTDRELIWGIYNDGNSLDGISYSWKYDGYTNWNFATNALSANQSLRSANSNNQDLGAWVVADSVSAVPEPSSLALFGIGACVAGIGATRRRRCEKQQEATA